MGLSFTHLIIILIIVLLIFGPSRLEGLGTSLGKAIHGFKKGLEGEEEKSRSDNVAKKTDDAPKT